MSNSDHYNVSVKKAREAIAKALRNKNTHVGYAGLLEKDAPIQAEWMNAIVMAMADQIAGPGARWVIYSPNESATSRACGYWSATKKRWVDEDEATRYSMIDLPAPDSDQFPASLGDDARPLMYKFQNETTLRGTFPDITVTVPDGYVYGRDIVVGLSHRLRLTLGRLMDRLDMPEVIPDIVVVHDDTAEGVGRVRIQSGDMKRSYSLEVSDYQGVEGAIQISVEYVSAYAGNCIDKLFTNLH